MSEHKIFTSSFSSVYPLYLKKAERKGRSKAEVDEIIKWLTGYSDAELLEHLHKESSFRIFFDQAIDFNPNASLIKGVVCGIRVEDIADPLMKKIRLLDKLIDELAKGKSLEKILRK